MLDDDVRYLAQRDQALARLDDPATDYYPATYHGYFYDGTDGRWKATRTHVEITGEFATMAEAEAHCEAQR